MSSLPPERDEGQPGHGLGLCRPLQEAGAEAVRPGLGGVQKGWHWNLSLR